MNNKKRTRTIKNNSLSLNVKSINTKILAIHTGLNLFVIDGLTVNRLLKCIGSAGIDCSTRVNFLREKRFARVDAVMMRE